MMNKLEKLLTSLTLAAAIAGCESTRIAPYKSKAHEPFEQQEEAGPIVIKSSTAASITSAYNSKAPRLIVVNKKYPHGAELGEDGRFRSLNIGVIASPISPKAPLKATYDLPDSVPKGWKWEEQGNWYRSPDRKLLWINGNVQRSLESVAGSVRDHEVLTWGSQEYAPRKQ